MAQFEIYDEKFADIVFGFRYYDQVDSAACAYTPNIVIVSQCIFKNFDWLLGRRYLCQGDLEWSHITHTE